MKKIVLFLAALVLLTHACIRDTGNYDYRDINELEFIGFQGLDSTIGATAATPFNIVEPRITLVPRLATSMGTEANLVFTWLHDSAGIRVPFHHGRNLENFEVPSFWDGPTTLIFRVEDVVSRKILNTRIFVNAHNLFRAGYFVLQEDAQGYMRLDVLSWLSGRGYDHLQDVLGGTDFPRQRGARQIAVLFQDQVMAAAFGNISIYIVTDEPDVYRVHPSTFQWVGERGHLRNAFLNPGLIPANTSVDNFFTPSAATEALLNIGGSLFHQSTAINTFFSVEINTTAERQRFPASRHFSRGSGNRWLIFDEGSQSFYSFLPVHNRWSTRITTSDTIVSYRNMGMELVFSRAARAVVGSAAEYLSYNILKDANGQFWLLRVVMENFEQQFWHRMNVPAGFNENSIMAVGGEFTNRQMYFAIGGNVYQYDVHNQRSTRVFTFPAGEVVTYMGFHLNGRHSSGGTDILDAHRFIVVGSFNEGTGVGTLTHFRIPEGTGTWIPYVDNVTGQLHRWSGFGRIRSVNNR